MVREIPDTSFRLRGKRTASASGPRLGPDVNLFACGASGQQLWRAAQAVSFCSFGVGCKQSPVCTPRRQNCGKKAETHHGPWCKQTMPALRARFLERCAASLRLLGSRDVDRS